jgi:hypothetical protein
MDVLKRLSPDERVIEALIEGNVATPRIAEMVAVHCFLFKVEGDDVEVLRYQLGRLQKTGMFEFEDEDGKEETREGKE